MSKRLNNISLLRIFSTLTVFIFHVCMVISFGQGIKYFPLYLGVQIFLFLSAFLYSRKDIVDKKAFMIKNLKKLYIPAILAIIFALFYALIIYSTLGPQLNLSYTQIISNADINGNNVSMFGHLWFIIAISFCYLLLPLLQKMFKYKTASNYGKCFVIILCLFDIVSCCWPMGKPIFTPFVLGYYYGNKYFNENNLNKIENNFWISLIVLILFSVVYYFVCNIQTTNKVLFIVVRCIYQLLPIILSLTFINCFLKMFKFTNNISWFGNFISPLDKLSFPFYLVHHVLLVGNGALLTASSNYALNIFICFMLSIGASIIMLYCIKGVNNLRTNTLSIRIKIHESIHNLNKS